MLFRIALSMKNKATFLGRYLYVQYILNTKITASWRTPKVYTFLQPKNDKPPTFLLQIVWCWVKSHFPITKSFRLFVSDSRNHPGTLTVVIKPTMELLSRRDCWNIFILHYILNVCAHDLHFVVFCCG